MSLLKLVLTASLVCGASAAGAASYHFAITGVGFAASGTITDDETVGFANLYPCPTCATGPGYLATGVTGTINGDAITGLAPLNSTAGNNNRVYPTSTPQLDWGDFGFATATTLYNVFEGSYYQNHYGYFLAVGNGPIFANAVSFSLSPAAVPEPATWVLMLGGLGAVGVALRRRAVIAAA